jgi:hypothetical protein
MNSQVGHEGMNGCQAPILGALEQWSQAAGDSVTHGVGPGVNNKEWQKEQVERSKQAPLAHPIVPNSDQFSQNTTRVRECNRIL